MVPWQNDIGRNSDDDTASSPLLVVGMSTASTSPPFRHASFCSGKGRTRRDAHTHTPQSQHPRKCLCRDGSGTCNKRGARTHLHPSHTTHVSRLRCPKQPSVPAPLSPPPPLPLIACLCRKRQLRRSRVVADAVALSEEEPCTLFSLPPSLSLSHRALPYFSIYVTQSLPHPPPSSCVPSKTRRRLTRRRSTRIGSAPHG